jgi:hypothetical protein
VKLYKAAAIAEYAQTERSGKLGKEYAFKAIALLEGVIIHSFKRGGQINAFYRFTIAECGFTYYLNGFGQGE